MKTNLLILLLSAFFSINCFSQQSSEYLEWLISNSINSGKIFGLYYSAKNNIEDDLARAISQGWEEKNYSYLIKFDKIIRDSLNLYYNRNRIENDYSLRLELYNKYKPISDSLRSAFWLKYDLLQMQELIKLARQGKVLTAEQISDLQGKPFEKVEEYMKAAKYKRINGAVNGYYIYSKYEKKLIKVYVNEHSIEYDWGMKNKLHTSDIQSAFWSVKIKKDIVKAIKSIK